MTRPRRSALELFAPFYLRLLVALALLAAAAGKKALTDSSRCGGCPECHGCSFRQAVLAFTTNKFGGKAAAVKEYGQINTWDTSEVSTVGS